MHTAVFFAFTAIVTPVGGGNALTLDVSQGSLAVVLKPAARASGESRAAVEVGATRGLTAEEIIARERAWDAGQREKIASYVAAVNTSLRFRIAEFPEPLDLTIRGRLFFQRGQPVDSTWEEFFFNAVKWKSKTIPRLPILQPEKVTTLPLDIRLTEEYDYTLVGETQVEGRPAYRVDFRPSDRSEKNRSSSRALTSKPTPKAKIRACDLFPARPFSAIFISFVSPAVGRPSVRKIT